MTSSINPAASRQTALASRAASSDLPNGRDPETPQEAAEEFEKVLVRRFVKVMTKDMFSTSLTGEDSAGWMKSQRGQQRDMMTDMLTDHLVESEALNISEQLAKEWGVSKPPPASPGPPLRQSLDPLPADPPQSHDEPRLDRSA